MLKTQDGEAKYITIETQPLPTGAQINNSSNIFMDIGGVLRHLTPIVGVYGISQTPHLTGSGEQKAVFIPARNLLGPSNYSDIFRAFDLNREIILTQFRNAFAKPYVFFDSRHSVDETYLSFIICGQSSPHPRATFFKRKSCRSLGFRGRCKDLRESIKAIRGNRHLLFRCIQVA